MAYEHWFPGKRAEVLGMAKNWVQLVSANKTAWSIPDGILQDLTAKTAAAQAAFDLVQSAARTAENTAQCQAAFADLEQCMRNTKNRCFFAPPLTDPNLISLGLKPKDTVKTPVPVPTSEAEADITFPDFHLIELVKIRRRGLGSSDPRSEHGVRIHFGVLDERGARGRFLISAVPETGEDLPHSVFTRRKKERFDFNGYSGKTVYFSLRWENTKGEGGPFGPLKHAVIP
jgi:hypothetical protein